jgi:ABC-type sugar transport system ATPase subunit
MPNDEVDQRVHEAARTLGLDEQLQKKPRGLSGGQRQRVAMGRAIVRQPQAFLIDEPLSNLDAKLRVQMRAEISRLQDELGVTTIYVTHDQTEPMTDRVAVMRKGELQEVDDPQVLYDHPDNLFVAGFIGSPAMKRPASGSTAPRTRRRERPHRCTAEPRRRDARPLQPVVVRRKPARAAGRYGCADRRESRGLPRRRIGRGGFERG